MWIGRPFAYDASVVKRLPLIRLVGPVVCVSGCLLFGTPAASAATVDRARVVALADRVSAAWLTRIGPNGKVELPGPGLSRPYLAGEGHRIALGYSLLEMASRLPRGKRRTTALTKAFSLIDGTYPKDHGKPFSLLFMPLAYRATKESFLDYEGARRHLIRWGRWINTRDVRVAVSGHDCYNDAECSNNWHLFRTVAGLETVDLAPIGQPVPGSFMADPAATVAASRAMLGRKLASNQGPLVTTGWQLGDAASISDPPLFPPAYHALALALLEWSANRHAEGTDAAARQLLARAEAYTLLSMAPDGDIALSGRSQLQSGLSRPPS